MTTCWALIHSPQSSKGLIHLHRVQMARSPKTVATTWQNPSNSLVAQIVQKALLQKLSKYLLHQNNSNPPHTQTVCALLWSTLTMASLYSCLMPLGSGSCCQVTPRLGQSLFCSFQTQSISASFSQLWSYSQSLSPGLSFFQLCSEEDSLPSTAKALLPSISCCCASIAHDGWDPWSMMTASKAQILFFSPLHKGAKGLPV